MALVIDVQDGICTCGVGSFKSLGTIEDHVWIRISTAYVDGTGVGEMKSYMHEVRVNGLD